MKMKHRVPIRVPQSATVDEAYESEVRRSTEHGERQHARAIKRLRDAERRLEKVRSREESRRAVSAYTRDLNIALQIVELRRQELSDLERLMRQSPQSAQHRGTKSFRPVGGAS
jgi:hypothetical protein